MIRMRLSITGAVQGVGFRPFAWRLASRRGLSGFVANTTTGVVIEVEGPATAVASFRADLAAVPPPALIEGVADVAIRPRGEPAGRFQILSSAADGGPVVPPPRDVATCDECLRELRDPADRRHGHAFVTCTACGPRFTVVERLPYDRAATTMASFAVCPACAAEYDDPGSRRFHAQSIACPQCGPTAWFVDSGGSATRPPQAAGAEAGVGAVAAARALLAAGGILAIKDVGGFHLACDATADGAVARLRDRKRRPRKPLAVMVADLAAGRRIAVVDDVEARLLEGPQRPIVLVRGRADAGLASGVAPGTDRLGVMLPSAPLQHLLCAGLPPLVMTSGNLAGEPIAIAEAEALGRLGTVADGFLMHDRAIRVPCDDSVVRVAAAGPLPIRLARGHAPLPLHLVDDGPAVLAVGSDLKAAVCLAVGDRALLGPHVGDVGTLETMQALERSADHLLRLCAAEPAAVAADLHPGSLAADWAARLADARGIPLVRIGHHEAHAASLLVEHHGRPTVPATLGCCLVACFDGTGYRDDGVIAGGEFLLADTVGIRHVASLVPFPLPGGDAAIRHPWRTALAVLAGAGIDWDDRLAAVRGGSDGERRLLRRQVESGLACVPTTSMGRLFDAVSAVLGGPASVSFEAEAATWLESLAARGPATDDGRYSFGFLAAENGGLRIDWREVVAAIVRDALAGEPGPRIAAAFHHAVVRMIGEARSRLAPPSAAVGLTGGVFQNVVLVERAAATLTAGGGLLRHRLVPPNDGGLAVGQAALARSRLGGNGQPVASAARRPAR